MAEMRIKAWMTLISLVNLWTLAGGRAYYESIRANPAIIGDEIKIILPPLSAVCLLVEAGMKMLPMNNEVHSASHKCAEDNILLFPNPSDGSFKVRNMPESVSRIEIQDLRGATVFLKDSFLKSPEMLLHTDLAPGVYFINFRNDNHSIIKKLIIK